MTGLCLQGAALGTMVGQLSYGKRQFESVDGKMRQLIPILHRAMNNFLPLIDADTAAFNQYMVLTPRDDRNRYSFRILSSYQLWH